MNFEGQYLTYSEYMTLGGELEIMPFNLLEFEARKIINTRTQNRLIGIETKNIPEDVKMCVNAMINSIDVYAKNTAKAANGVASENIDGYSVNYINASQIKDIIISKQNDLEDIMFNYLSNTMIDKNPILYLGVN